MIKLLLIFSFILHCVPFVWAADDWELWLGNTVKFKINDKINLNFLEEFRMHTDMSKFYTYVLYTGPSFNINRYIDAAIWYKFVESKKNGHWKDTHRYDLDLTLKYDLREFKLSNRSRFENNVTDDSCLYRDRIQISRDLKIFEKKYTSYISNEFFLDMDPDDGYHENRASIGISTDFFFHTKLTLYYMYRSKKNHDDWKNANIIGTFIGLSF